MRATTNRLTALLGGLAFLAGTGTAIGQETPPPGGQPKDFQLAEATEYMLPNGLGVTMVPYGKVPKTSVQLVIRAGNIDESADEVWLADLMGDLMKEGTTTRSAAQISQEAAGMGGSLSIGVGLDQSSVSGQVLSEYGPGPRGADRRRHVEPGVSRLRARATEDGPGATGQHRPHAARRR